MPTDSPNPPQQNAIKEDPRTQQHPEQRVAVFIDHSNLYHSARAIFNGVVHFKNLVDEAIAGRKLVRAFSYVVRSEMEGEEKFFEALRSAGMETRIKDLQTFSSGEKKGDWDVGLAMDVVRIVDKIDCVVLVSGDGDFAELLRYVKAHGVRAEVLAFGGSASKFLTDEADLFTDLSKNPGRFIIRRRRVRTAAKTHAAPKPASR